ncbi:N-acetyltransferase [Campylobacterota bacterium]|nr:N-acetyltransferase [Campylobacterota bacterium]
MLFSLLDDRFNRTGFDCGEPELNIFLRERASQFVKRGFCRVYILTDENCVIGYYSLSQFAVKVQGLPPKIAKKFPSNMLVPCTLIGRLAVDRRFQDKQIGKLLLIDALKNVLEASKKIGGYCVVVDVKNEQVKGFYAKYGFIPFIDNELRMFLPLDSIAI